MVGRMAAVGPGRHGGIHAVFFALFDASENLDREAMRAQAQYCANAGVDGINVLGLATEVNKLDAMEKRRVIDWAAQDRGDLPLSVTITGNSIGEQIALIRHAEGAGADWLVLQPPTAGIYAASEYLEFFARVAEATELPVAIQNAPAYMGRGLSAEDITLLIDRCPSISIVKAEDSAVVTRGIVEAAPDGLTVLGGRGGLEMLDLLYAGVDGFILAPDIVDCAVRIFSHWRNGEHKDAYRLYEAALPGAVFTMQSLEHLITYGKRLFGLRAGISICDRTPILRPTEFGLARIADYAVVQHI